MPAEREVHKRNQRGKLKEDSSAVSQPDSIEGTSAHDIQPEPTDKSYKMEEILKSDVAGQIQDDATEPSETEQTEVTGFLGSDETDLMEPKFNLDDLNDEIEDILNELEQLKTKVIPIMDKRDYKPDVISPLATGPDTSSLFESHINGESTDASETADIEEESDGIEYFQGIPASSRGIKHWGKGIFILAAIVLAGILGYYLFFPSNIQTPEKIQSKRNAGPETTNISTRPADSADILIQKQNRSESRSTKPDKPVSNIREGESGVLAGARDTSTEQAADSPSVTRENIETVSSLENSVPETADVSPNPATSPQSAIPVFRQASAPPASPPNEGSLPKLPPQTDESSGNSRATELPEPAALPAENMVMAESIVRVKPVYPEQAKEQKVTGIVGVEIDINELGDVVRAQAVSGPDLLRNAAEEAVLQWKFKPASVNGVNTASKARISIPFNLR